MLYNGSILCARVYHFEPVGRSSTFELEGSHKRTPSLRERKEMARAALESDRTPELPATRLFCGTVLILLPG